MERAEPARLRRSQRDPCGGDAVGAEDRQFAEDHAQALVLGQQAIDVRQAGAAIAAGIIVEFDQRDVGLGGALPRRGERGFERQPVGGDGRRILPVAQQIGGLDKDFGMPRSARRGRWCRRPPSVPRTPGPPAINAAPIAPPPIAAIQQRPPIFAHLFLVFPDLFLGHHGDVLGAKIVGVVLGDAAHRHFGAGQRELGIALEVVALGGGERGARRIAFIFIDDAELVPGEGIVVVAADRVLEDCPWPRRNWPASRSRSARGRASPRSSAGRAPA